MKRPLRIVDGLVIALALTMGCGGTTGLGDAGPDATTRFDASDDASPEDSGSDPCRRNPCLNGGVCTNVGGTPSCACGVLLTAEFCQCVGVMPMRIDWRSMGDSTSRTIALGDLTVTGSADLRRTSMGLGVLGGAADDAIDGTETITFSFASNARDVQYWTTDPADLDGDFAAGEIIMEAFDATGASLGTDMIQTSYIPVVPVDRWFGAGAISRFTVTAAVDSHRHALLDYTATAVTPRELDFTSMGTTTTASISMMGVAISGSATLAVNAGGGIGVTGGTHDGQIDGSEFVTFAFDEPMVNVAYFVGGAGNLDMDAFIGEAVIEAFGSTGASLGSVMVSNTARQSVSTHFGGVRIASFTVAADVDSHSISRLEYGPCEAPP